MSIIPARSVRCARANVGVLCCCATFLLASLLMGSLLLRWGAFELRQNTSATAPVRSAGWYAKLGQARADARTVLAVARYLLIDANASELPVSVPATPARTTPQQPGPTIAETNAPVVIPTV